MLVRTSLALLITLAACSDDSKSNTADAAPPGDAAAATVTTVTCPGGTVPTITATDGVDNTYSPKTLSIGVGQIVKFTMPSSHNVVPALTGTTDAGLMVNFNETKCLMFTKAGAFNFRCGPHSFVGTVTVQ
jgi:plastocyanin